jgi:hypothetical protein
MQMGVGTEEESPSSIPERSSWMPSLGGVGASGDENDQGGGGVGDPDDDGEGGPIFPGGLGGGCTVDPYTKLCVWL